MTTMNTDATTPRPLRLWPGVVAAALLVLVRFGLPLVSPESAGTAILGGLAGGLLVIVWWLFFSRAPWLERIGAVVLMAGLVYATARVVHPSIANGMMGMMPVIFSVPLLAIALVAALAASAVAVGWRAARGDRGRPRARLRVADGHPDRRHERIRRGRPPLAVDRDAGGTSARAGQGRADARPGGSRDAAPNRR